MPDSPLLDLRDDWQHLHAALTAVHDRVAALYAASNNTWTDLLGIRHKVRRAQQALGTLPQPILDGIAHDQADLDEWEAKLG